MNNKGFMMAEVVVVSAIILVALVGLYTSYNKIFSIFNQRIDYYDVGTLYELASYRDYKLGETSTDVNNPVYSTSLDAIYYIDKDDLNSLNVSRQTFKDYIVFLSGSVDFGDMSQENILVMENCVDNDNCKYAYLEVFK